MGHEPSTEQPAPRLVAHRWRGRPWLDGAVHESLFAVYRQRVTDVLLVLPKARTSGPSRDVVMVGIGDKSVAESRPHGRLFGRPRALEADAIGEDSKAPRRSPD